MPHSDPRVARIYKAIGETPLQALERFRSLHPKLQEVPLTYAGRLDPLAEGELLILIGEECKHKEKYLNLDKEYEIEVVFGVSTDTYDVLGLAELGASKKLTWIDPHSYVGKFSQPYPPYSSKTVDGVALHVKARSNELPEEMPEKEVEIYSIEIIGCWQIRAADLLAEIQAKIQLVEGDFRQDEIRARWQELLGVEGAKSDREFDVLRFRVHCSSGTYMRSLAHTMGKDAGMGACALGIKRTKIFD